jgi:superoxide dismutase, Cu-Zn family
MNSSKLVGALACGGLSFVAIALAQQTPPATAKPIAARASFVDAAGKKMGTATLTQTPGGVLILLDLTGLPPGEHGFHFHEKGKCERNTGFKSAGDHYAPQGRGEHGYHTAGGPHAGDMPNQFVGRDGTLRAHVLNEKVSLAPGKTSLLDADGTAMVVHARPDDYRTQPSGDSGDRIACGVIERG